MKIAVNLASQPYVELKPVYQRLRTWMAILALTGCALWFLYRSERGQAQDAVARVATVQQRVQQLESEEQHYKALMAEPRNAAILQQSDFLNGLFRRKAFSWTATMEDLENVLPSGVQVLSIEPLISKDGHVTIHLRVTGARDRALDLIRNLEQSKHFASPRLMDETLATTGSGSAAAMEPVSATNQVNFDILADYRPLPLPAQAVKEEKAEEGAKTSETKTPGKKAPQVRRRRQRLTKPSAAIPVARGGRP
ncbi:MAG TPA: PilN domain-containing protein [Acidobacteriaceae bacterium]|nr:PilN domain-containing protein [Acidobacteriaceae bacterium]